MENIARGTKAVVALLLFTRFFTTAITLASVASRTAETKSASSSVQSKHNNLHLTT